MSIPIPFSRALSRLDRDTRDWLAAWRRILRFTLLILALALTPSTYGRRNRHAIAQQLVLAAARNLLWYSVLTALLGVVLIRIVVVTARSYGLSHYALEMVVRVLVLELIPLTAALFVALRYSLPDGVEFAQLRVSGGLDALRRQGVDIVRHAFVPRILAGLFSVWLLAAVSCVTTLVLTYLISYGFTPWALEGYTRAAGSIFNPAVATILALKILFFSLAVAVIPLASAYEDGTPSGVAGASHGLADMVRLFSMVLLVEVASLMGNYS